MVPAVDIRALLRQPVRGEDVRGRPGSPHRSPLLPHRRLCLQVHQGKLMKYKVMYIFYMGRIFLEGYYSKNCFFFLQSLTVDFSYMVHCRDPIFFPVALNYLLAPGNVFLVTLILDGGTMWLWGKMCSY